ncbi:MAG: SGNH/GDSL hydrolase family protein [Bacillota bacterium]
MKIVCLGDSLTRGVSFVKGRLRILKENYPNALQQLFSENNKDVSVINKGVFNDNSHHLVKRLEKDVINEKPQYVIIEIGGNDCNFKWAEVAEKPWEKHKAIVPMNQYIDNIKTIITNLKEHQITPVIATLPPLDPVRYYKNISEKYSPAISHWISEVGGIGYWHGLYNQNLNMLAEECSTLKVDVRSALKKAGNLVDYISDDGIHLTAEGYKVLSEEIYRNIEKWTNEENVSYVRQ